MLQTKLDGLLAQFDARAEPFYEREVGRAIRDLLRERDEAAQLALHESAEDIAFNVAETDREETSRWGTYYGPKLIWPTGDGATAEDPKLESITTAVLDYWQARADAVQHPRLKARYADLVWDLSHRVAQRRADVRFARMAIDATLQTALGSHCEFSCDAHCKLKRALAIALCIDDAPRAGAVRDAAIAYERATATDDELGTWGFAFDLLIEDQHKTLLTADQERPIIDDLEARLARAAYSEPPHLNPFGAESAALRLARHYRRRNLPDDLRRVMNTYVQAWIKIAQQAMPLLGATWLEKVHRTLLEFGLKAEAEAMEPQLRALGARSHENMATISHTMKCTKEQIDAFVGEMTAGTFADALQRIACHFVPDPDSIRSLVLDIAKQSPLLSLLTHRIQDGTGRVVATVGSVSDDPEGRLVLQMAQDIGFRSPSLRLVLERAQAKHGATLEDYLQFAFQSPAFPPENRVLIERGLRAFLEGDFVVAIHILIPQIEAGVRYLLAATGGPVYEVGRHGGNNLRNLDKLLSDPRLVASLTERIALYLRVLLTDQRGWNIRNLVSHGLVGPGAFGFAVADRIVHVLLLLALVREAPSNPGDETGGRQV